jgi:hypothetical protein
MLDSLVARLSYSTRGSPPKVLVYAILSDRLRTHSHVWSLLSGPTIPSDLFMASLGRMTWGIYIPTIQPDLATCILTYSHHLRPSTITLVCPKLRLAHTRPEQQVSTKLAPFRYADRSGSVEEWKAKLDASYAAANFIKTNVDHSALGASSYIAELINRNKEGHTFAKTAKVEDRTVEDFRRMGLNVIYVAHSNTCHDPEMGSLRISGTVHTTLSW